MATREKKRGRPRSEMRNTIEEAIVLASNGQRLFDRAEVIDHARKTLSLSDLDLDAMVYKYVARKVSDTLRQRDPHGIRRYVALPMGDGTYQWGEFQDLNLEEIEVVLRFRDRQFRDLGASRATIEQIRDRMKRAARKGEPVVVGDVIEKVLAKEGVPA